MKHLTFFRHFSIFLLIILSSCMATQEGPVEPLIEEDIIDITQTSDYDIKKTTSISIKEVEPERKPMIEVLWQMPQEEVEGFVIKYGYKEKLLSQEVKVKAEDLQVKEHPKFGKVYRYMLKDVPPQGDVFIAITSYNGDVISSQSKIFKVAE